MPERVLAFPVLLHGAEGLARVVGGNKSQAGLCVTHDKCHEADSDLLCRDPGPWEQAPDQVDDRADLEILLCLSDPRRIKRRKKPFLTLKGYGTYVCIFLMSAVTFCIMHTQYFALTNLNFKFVLKPSVSPSC